MTRRLLALLLAWVSISSAVPVPDYVTNVYSTRPSMYGIADWPTEPLLGLAVLTDQGIYFTRSSSFRTQFTYFYISRYILDEKRREDCCLFFFAFFVVGADRTAAFQFSISIFRRRQNSLPTYSRRAFAIIRSWSENNPKRHRFLPFLTFGPSF